MRNGRWKHLENCVTRSWRAERLGAAALSLVMCFSSCTDSAREVNPALDVKTFTDEGRAELERALTTFAGRYPNADRTLAELGGEKGSVSGFAFYRFQLVDELISSLALLDQATLRTVSPHKNRETLAHCFSALRKKVDPFQLVWTTNNDTAECGQLTESMWEPFNGTVGGMYTILRLFLVPPQSVDLDAAPLARATRILDALIDLTLYFLLDRDVRADKWLGLGESPV